MSEYVKRIKTADGDKQIDYTALANLPKQYASTGQNEDGWMTQKAVTESLADAVSGIVTATVENDFIRVDLDAPFKNGQEIAFRAPCSAAEATSLTVRYPDDNGVVHFSLFTLADAHANDLKGLANLFSEGAVVEVILDTDNNMAFVQNADTNSYLEGRFAEIGAADQEITSQGRNAKYTFSTGGWKRILNIIRGTSGTVNMCLGCNYPFRSMQILSFDFSGYVKFPDQKDGTKGDTTDSGPVLFKRYENCFGITGTQDSPQAKITKVRVGYPAPGTSFPEKPEDDYEHNPINCYVDVYVEIDESKIIEGRALPNFNMNYAGFADSHNCEAIVEETDATDTGIYGEELVYHEVSLADMDAYAQMQDIKDLDARLIKLEEASSWAEIKRIVGLGLADKHFPIGTQFLVKNSLVGDMHYDVVAHDHFKTSTGNHTMTLMCHDILPLTGISYDIPDVFYWHDPAYHSGNISGDCIFHLPTACKSFAAGYYLIKGVNLDPGEKLVLKYKTGIKPDYSRSLNLHSVVCVDASGKTLSDLLPIYGPYANVDGLTYNYDLGTSSSKTKTDRFVNHISRAANGSNDYNKSVIKQVVFKSGTNGAGIFNTSYDGECNFIDSFDPEFLAVVGNVQVPCEYCKTYEPYDMVPGAGYYLSEKFFLPSIQEITGVSNGSNDHSTQLEYFKNVSAVDRIKYLNGVAEQYFTRSPYQGSATTAHTVCVIDKSGSKSNASSGITLGVVPMVNIVG